MGEGAGGGEVEREREWVCEEGEAARRFREAR